MIKRMRGFTLIELMIVVAIVAILAAIALPSYARYADRARRADGQNLLNHVAAAQERYYSTHNRYTSNTANLGYTGAAESEKGYYKLALTVPSDGQRFDAKAMAQGAQTGDACGNLAIDNTGATSFSGSNQTNGKCW